MNCPKCGAQIQDEKALYCPHCGNLIETMKLPLPPPPPKDYGLTEAGIFGFVAACLCVFLGLDYVSIGSYSSIWQGWASIGVLGTIAFGCGLVGSVMAFKKSSYILSMLGGIFSLFYGAIVMMGVLIYNARNVMVWFYAFPILIIVLSFISARLIHERKNSF